MADNKKYYYLKLKDNFFDTEEIKIIESAENGYLYTNILLKMYLCSLKNEGKLTFKENIPYNTKMLSTITGHNIDVVEKAIKIFKEFGLIEILTTGEIFMLDIQQYIGRHSNEAERKRIYREKIKREQLLLGDGTMSQKCPDKRPPEIEIEKEREIDLEKEKHIVEQKGIPYKEIMDYLNTKTGKDYKHTTKATQDKIKARWLEGFKLEDFKKVIDNKVMEWQGTDMEKFLRVETLFGTKFESYKNQTITKVKAENPHKTKFHLENSRADKYTKEELNELIRKKQEAMRKKE